MADNILEIAVSRAPLTDPFNAMPLYERVLHLPSAWISTLDPFVLKMHSANGLLAECDKSTVTTSQVERDLLALIPHVYDREDMPVLAGSAIHFDHAFLKHWMPHLAERFSHRHYDVSTIKLFCRSLGMEKPPRAEAHRAAADVRESIDHARQCAAWLEGHFIAGHSIARAQLGLP